MNAAWLRRLRDLDRRLRPVGRWILVAGLAGWALGQALRDRFAPAAPLFYIASPALLVALLLAAGIALIERRRRAALCWGLAALAPLGFVVFVENQWFRPSPRPAADRSTLRAVHWNVMRGWGGWERIVERIARREPDLVILSEVPSDLDAVALGQRLWPRCGALRLGSLAILARGNLRDGDWLAKGYPLRVYQVKWDVDGATLHVMAADLASGLLHERRPTLLKLNNLVREHQPDLVMGDFNAPRRSTPLDPPPEGWRHAYRAAGCGWGYTWPVPLPVLAIDQCLVGERLEPRRYRLVSTTASDHRMQVLDFVYVGPDE